MDLSDERFHRKCIPWSKLEAEGVEARKVMKEAQKQRMWILARKAEHRWHNRNYSKSSK
tara:strand:- start:212 stop:388 length:177 start_codon:yes stop_codon:yes gene_type:complete